MVTHAVNNEWMCSTLDSIKPQEIELGLLTGGAWLAQKITAAQGPSDPECLDIDASENQTAEAFAMQQSIDTKFGGPGMGWYRIVRTPTEARQVISQGKLAVVLGMEVDNLFECGLNSPPCTPDFVRTKLTQYYAQGVRHFFPIHFYDNQFGGSANANALITNNFKNPMTKRDCYAEGYEYDHHQCNARGLTSLGRTLVSEMKKKGIIIDVDHMSAASYNDTMAIVSPTKYPVVSGHTGFTEIARGDPSNEGNRTPAQITQILSVGGMFAIIPHQGALDTIVPAPHFPPASARTDIQHQCGNSSETVAQGYLYAIEHTGYGPVGFGTDFNGFAGWPSPRFGADACSGGKAPHYAALPTLSYPLHIAATGVNVTLNRSVVGARTFDFNTDGLGHIGMLPDMISDFQTMGITAAELDPLFFSAEGYIRLWERATYLAQ